MADIGGVSCVWGAASSSLSARGLAGLTGVSGLAGGRGRIGIGLLTDGLSCAGARAKMPNPPNRPSTSAVKINLFDMIRCSSRSSGKIAPLFSSIKPKSVQRAWQAEEAWSTC